MNPPVYGSFYHWIEEAKLEQVDVPLVRTDRTWQLDLNALEAAFAAGAMVKVSSAGTGFQVVVTGEAMGPGIEGQPTRVRLPGGKVVSGLVRDAQTVEIDL